VKGYATEGGIRVPAIVKLPGSDQHQLASEFASALDVAPTIYELVGVNYPNTFGDHKNHPLSGTSMLPYLQLRSDRIHAADYGMGWELFGRAAFRRGPWKITWTEKPFGTSEFELFAIDSDPGESRDVRQQHPDIYRQMIKSFEEYARSNGVVIVRPNHWLRPVDDR
jgi:arylsulfatase